ncbi:MspA family porin [Gordonia amicalis]|uniref:MspA family porin n=1 Tax=Gordonia amicalis TaxID=89053 RepID=UPI0015F61CF4|nr:MspA family porin [Gordonia amicalis]MBA5845992.1 MspA family porin [Gordonia amicalis]UOG21239.1 MspA family porin [Gordonia amicalis]
MSKFSKLGLRRAAGAVAIASAAVVGLAGMGVGDAAAAGLPNGYKKASGIDGESIQTWRTGESAYPITTVANNPTSRGFVISGTYTAKASEGVGGKLAVKYIIGCQVDVSGVTLGLDGAISLSAATLSGSFGLPLAPGQVAVVDITDKDLSDKGIAAVQLSQLSFTLPGCGGFASARSAVKVIGAKGYDTADGKLSGEGTLIQSTLYGKPFSIN